MHHGLKKTLLEEIVSGALSAHPDLVEKYKHRLERQRIIGFFVGMIMQATKGRSKLADVKVALNQMLQQ